jgi:hypothetical protein
MCRQSNSRARTRKPGDHPHIRVRRWLGGPRIFLSALLSSEAVAFSLSRGAQHLRDGKLATSYKDYERKVQTSETLLKLAMIRLMVRRLARSPA